MNRGLVVASGAAGLFMVGDAVISMDVPNDKRPWLQAGRVLRGFAGLALMLYALSNTGKTR